MINKSYRKQPSTWVYNLTMVMLYPLGAVAFMGMLGYACLELMKPVAERRGA